MSLNPLLVLFYFSTIGFLMYFLVQCNQRKIATGREERWSRSIRNPKSPVSFGSSYFFSNRCHITPNFIGFCTELTKIGLTERKNHCRRWSWRRRTATPLCWNPKLAIRRILTSFSRFSCISMIFDACFRFCKKIEEIREPGTVRKCNEKGGVPNIYSG